MHCYDTRNPNELILLLPSDDGAYYYEWELNGHNTDPRRPWAAEVGLVLVKEALWAAGVPIQYVQL
jgi:hypothetical protein